MPETQNVYDGVLKVNKNFQLYTYLPGGAKGIPQINKKAKTIKIVNLAHDMLSEPDSSVPVLQVTRKLIFDFFWQFLATFGKHLWTKNMTQRLKQTNTRSHNFLEVK